MITESARFLSRAPEMKGINPSDHAKPKRKAKAKAKSKKKAQPKKKAKR
jgi:hypothetical protein